MLNWILDRVVEWWLARCPHDPSYVTADILEGGVDKMQLQFCQRCAAHRFVFGDPFSGVEPLRYSEWRRARPLWVEPAKEAQ